MKKTPSQPPAKARRRSNKPPQNRATEAINHGIITAPRRAHDGAASAARHGRGRFACHVTIREAPNGHGRRKEADDAVFVMGEEVAQYQGAQGHEDLLRTRRAKGH